MSTPTKSQLCHCQLSQVTLSLYVTETVAPGEGGAGGGAHLGRASPVTSPPRGGWGCHGEAPPLTYRKMGTGLARDKSSSSVDARARHRERLARCLLCIRDRPGYHAVTEHKKISSHITDCPYGNVLSEHYRSTPKTHIIHHSVAKVVSQSSHCWPLQPLDSWRPRVRDSCTREQLSWPRSRHPLQILAEHCKHATCRRREPPFAPRRCSTHPSHRSIEGHCKRKNRRRAASCGCSSASCASRDELEHCLPAAGSTNICIHV